MSSKPSEDHDESEQEASDDQSQAQTLKVTSRKFKRQVAVDFHVPQAVLTKISCCKVISEKAIALKDHVGEFDFCKQPPSQWIKTFEIAVRSCNMGSNEGDLGDFYLAYLPYFLNVKHRSWFWNARSDGETWTEFKKKFVDAFWSKFWDFTEKALVSEPDEDDPLLDYATNMIEKLKNLMPELSDKSLITLCILDLPQGIRPHLQEGITGTVEMFLSMVEAADIQLGRSKRDFGSEEEEEKEENRQEKRQKTTDADLEIDEDLIDNKIKELAKDQMSKMEKLIDSKFEELLARLEK